MLAGGFIARTSYYPSFSYKVPTLTLGGSLDGLARVTRTVAESFYNTPDKVNFPVAVVAGMNHYQWGSGAPSLLESQRDLRAEVSLEQAHAAAAELIADFMAQRLGTGGGAKVAAAVKRTATFIKPIIEAYEYEGSRHFNAPRQIGGPGESACVKGGCPDKSAWAPVAQAVIAGRLDGWAFSATNEFVDCSSTPITGAEFHLPNITADAATKSVATTTYSQCKWDLADAYDTGFVYTSASEIGTKLSSLQVCACSRACVRACMAATEIGAMQSSLAVPAHQGRGQEQHAVQRRRPAVLQDGEPEGVRLGPIQLYA